MKYKIIAGASLLILLSVAASVYFYRQHQEPVKEDVKNTIAAVRKLMLLPTDEEPTVMQISDIAKLKDQPFFANAVNGDRVLIYVKTKKAILYRTQINKIIDVAPVNLGDATQSARTK